MILTAGTYGNIIGVLVPRVIAEEEVDEGLKVLENAISAVENDGAFAQAVAP
jgi:4-aminobutyrate aminotransferase-like enzyme